MNCPLTLRSLVRMRKKRYMVFVVVMVFLSWNIMTYYVLVSKPPSGQLMPDSVQTRLDQLEADIQLQLQQNQRLLDDLKKFRQNDAGMPQPSPRGGVQNIPVQEKRPVVNVTLLPLVKPIGPGIQSNLAEIRQHSPQGRVENVPVQENRPIVNDKHLPPVKTIDGVPVANQKPEEKPLENVVANQGGFYKTVEQAGGDPNKVILPILMIACDRVTISKSLDVLLKYRPSADRFPIIVSQDCGNAPTAKVIRSYGDKVTHIQQPDLSDIKLPPKEKKFKGYFKISRHYKWALNQIFHTFNYTTVIIVEDDLYISPDFFEYFAAVYPYLHSDPLLWCVSAWNDNGKANMVENDPELLYRTDFFPGLGWMVERDTWLELEPKWPVTFWDDWMRHPEQRQNRECIRPEISRTSTFGKIGVSKGQFFEKHLKFIKLNDKHVPFTKMDLSYLKKEQYDTMFVKKVYSSPLLSVNEAQSGAKPELKAVRVQYDTKEQFKKYAKQLGIMEDLKAGVPRAGYRGVVSFMRNGRRVYLSPAPNWSSYDPKWN